MTSGLSQDGQPSWVEVNEGVVEITQRGVDWWQAFAARMRPVGRFTDVKLPAVVGGIVAVACDSEADARSLVAHMVEFGGLPAGAVKVKTRGARA